MKSACAHHRARVPLVPGAGSLPQQQRASAKSAFLKRKQRAVKLAILFFQSAVAAKIKAMLLCFVFGKAVKSVLMRCWLKEYNG